MPWDSWRGLVADVALAAVVTALMVTASSQSGDVPARPLDAWAVAAIGVVGAWTAFARRVPRVAVVGSCVTFYAALAFGVPAFSPALALGIPVIVVAWSGYLWWGTAVLGVVAVTGAPYRLMGPGAEPFGQVALSTLFDLALVAVLLLLGETLRSRHALREEAELRLRLAEQEHQHRLTAERLRTARDLHDVLSHTVAVVSIQANVAAESIDTHPAQAKQAVERVRAATQEAVADLHSTLAVLRQELNDEHHPGPAPGMRQLPDLVEAIRASGLRASLRVTGAPVNLRPTVELAVYRIVQESLTNVLRHSGAASAAVVVEHTADAVEVEIRDDGTGDSNRQAPDGEHRGSGLRGMAERVEALGGWLQHGPASGTPGYQVRAGLPTGGFQ